MIARRQVLLRTALLAHPHPSTSRLATAAEMASHSEEPLVDRATDPSKTSHLTLLDHALPMASHQRGRATPTRDLGGSTEMEDVRVTTGAGEDQAHHAAVVAALDPSQHMIARF